MPFKIIKKSNSQKNEKLVAKKVKKEVKNCRNCASFVFPKEKFDTNGFKVDFGYCSAEKSELYKKSVLMEHVGCTVFS